MVGMYIVAMNNRGRGSPKGVCQCVLPLLVYFFLVVWLGSHVHRCPYVSKQLPGSFVAVR